jgi:hypothetical protein
MFSDNPGRRRVGWVRPVGLLVLGPVLAAGLGLVAACGAGQVLPRSTVATRRPVVVASGASGTARPARSKGPTSVAVQRVSVAPATGRFRLVTAPASARARYAAFGQSLSGVYSALSIRGLEQGGKPAGAVAVFTFPRMTASSAVFRDQIVGQLLSGVAGPALDPFRTVSGRRVAFAEGMTSGAGWFDGTRAYVIYATGPQTGPELFAGYLAATS